MGILGRRTHLVLPGAIMGSVVAAMSGARQDVVYVDATAQTNAVDPNVKPEKISRQVRRQMERRAAKALR